jgi:transglutaminase-like putative cysteine protease
MDWFNRSTIMPSCRNIHTGLLLAFTLAGITAAGAAVAAAPPERDVWYAISDGEQRYGSMNVIVRRLDDGNLDYEVTSLLKVELLGTRQEFGRSTTALIAPDLSPLRLKSDAEQMSGPTRMTGRATDDGFVIEREYGGQTYKSTYSFGDGIGLILDLALGDWLHRLAGDIDPSPEPADASRARRVRVLAAESGDITEVRVQPIQRDADGSIWSIESDREWASATVRLDGDGVLIEQVIRRPPMRVERATREEAMRTVHRRIPDRELLVFPIDREMPPLRRLQRIDVQLTWNDIPLDEFELEDFRQQIKSITTDGDRHTAIVALVRKGEILSDVTLPLPEGEFESALGETDFIKPHDERIAAAAREIVGAETSALATTRAICEWVSRYIEPAMIAETLSGPQVLERRTGKCTEYSTLFASLARAAGIPTRIALGERRFNGSWGGHMWNEVFIGEWIPVDASTNEVGGSLDLLKFIHSDTVMGTQSLRWKLTESLEIAIADFELLPGAAAAEPGLREGIYTNAAYGFRFQLPDDQWTIDESLSSGVLLLRLRPPAGQIGESAKFHVTAFNLPGGVAAKTLIDARLSAHRSTLDEFEIQFDEAIEVGGAAGHRICFRGAPRREGGVPIRVTEVVLLRSEAGVLLNLIGTEKLHDLRLDAFETILKTFQFIEE